ncbi:MAG: phospholipid-binding protein [Sulfuritalea sp.]|nr:phospholipid-binding protein [Sulfuritalea sp.]
MKAFLATLLAAASFSTFAQGLTVDWTWKKDHNCSITSPELAIGNIPEGTKKLEVNMRDLDFRNFDHGGGIVDYTGSNGNMTLAAGALKQYKGPCPGGDFYGFGHDYVIYVSALGADDTKLASGNNKKTFSSTTAK